MMYGIAILYDEWITVYGFWPKKTKMNSCFYFQIRINRSNGFRDALLLQNHNPTFPPSLQPQIISYNEEIYDILTPIRKDNQIPEILRFLDFLSWTKEGNIFLYMKVNKHTYDKGKYYESFLLISLLFFFFFLSMLIVNIQNLLLEGLGENKTNCNFLSPIKYTIL